MPSASSELKELCRELFSAVKDCTVGLALLCTEIHHVGNRTQTCCAKQSPALCTALVYFDLCICFGELLLSMAVNDGNAHVVQPNDH